MNQEEQDKEMKVLNEKIERWSKLNLKFPMVFDEHDEPIMDKDIPIGSIVYVPVYFPSYEKCSLEKDNAGFYLKSVEFGDTYRVDYGPNWFVTSELP